MNTSTNARGQEPYSVSNSDGVVPNGTGIRVQRAARDLADQLRNDTGRQYTVRDANGLIVHIAECKRESISA